MTSLPELFNFLFSESQYASDPQLSPTRELVKSKTHEKTHSMNRYYTQFVNDFYVKEKVVWLDEKLVIPTNLASVVNNPFHAIHHGKTCLTQLRLSSIPTYTHPSH